MDAKHAAAVLGISTTRMGELLKSGRLPARRVGRIWIIREQDITDFAEKERPAGRPRKAAKPE